MMANRRQLHSSHADSAFKRIAVLWFLAALVGAPTILQAQDAHVVTDQVRAQVTAQPELPAAGPADANVTIVEFFDYNCPYCKKAAPELKKLLLRDRQVRIIFKEWPIFGEGSTYAARSAIAANWQGRFLAAHDALIGSKSDLDTEPQIDAVLQSAGIDMTRLSLDRTRHSPEIDAVLARSVKEAKSLGLRGTPGFLIGRRLESRALTAEQFQNVVSLSRATP
jgi:protein-disulfide isomerase